MLELDAKAIARLTQSKYNYVPHNYPYPIGLWPNEQESLAWAGLMSDPNYSWMEIGSFAGGSAAILLEAYKAIGGQRKVYSVDRNFATDKDGELIDRAIKIGGFEDKHKKITVDSLNLEQAYTDKEKLSFAFLDGWHSFKGLLVDLVVVYPYLTNGAYVCFHDTAQQPYRDKDLDIYLNLANNNYDIWMQEKLPAPADAKQTYNLDCLVAYAIKNFNFDLVTNPMLDGTNNCLVILRKKM